MLNKTTMKNIDAKILRSISTKKLNLTILGERKWFNYFIRTSELIWSRNNFDGYKIEVYSEKYGTHLTAITI